MGDISTIVSLCSGGATVLCFLGIFVKYGNDKGVTDTTLKNIEKKLSGIPHKSEIDATLAELRKDVDANAKDINAIGSKVNQIQLENMQVVTALSSDLGWIKSSLTDIKTEMQKKRSSRNA